MPELTTGFRVPDWLMLRAVRHYDLSATDIVVFVAVCSGRRRGQEVSRVSVADLEERTRLSRTAVKTSLAYLRKIALIEQVEPKKGRRPAAYRIPEHMPWPQMQLGPGRRATHDGMAWRAAEEP